MKATLVILAAGLGSRYGGRKQVDALGPCGETMMAYSAYDAVRAGFEKIVFIIKPELLEVIQSICGNVLSKMVEVAYVVQDFSSLPDFYQVSPQRVKPFGTVHAVLCAQAEVEGPFAVINSDDYYGPKSFERMMLQLEQLPDCGHGVMLGYRLDNTLSPTAIVTRGICNIEDDHLVSVAEIYKIQLAKDGRIFDVENPANPVELPPGANVSMSFWGFTPWIFEKMEIYFRNFLKNLPQDSLKGEYLLPILVDDLLSTGELTMTVQPSCDHWFGVTSQEDRPIVMEALLGLHQVGLYPTPLFPSDEDHS